MIALIIISVILGSLSAGCMIYSIFAFHEKGPILMNEYILATAEEKRRLARQKPEKRKRDYRFAAKVFLVLSIILFIVLLDCILLIFNIHAPVIFGGLIIILVSGLIIYVLGAAIKDGEFR